MYAADNQLFFSNTTVYLACFLGYLPESSGILNTVIENLNLLNKKIINLQFGIFITEK